MRILLDTNVVLDGLLKRQNFQDADIIFKANKSGKINAFVTAASLTDTYYLLQLGIKRKTGAKDEPLVRQLILHCLQNFGILETNKMILNAAYSLQGVDFEDDIQIESATVHQIDFIITNDKKGFRKSPVAVVSPADFVANYL